MYSGISIRVDGKSLGLTTLKGEDNLLINIANKVELFLAEGATLLSENIKLLDNNSDVQITLSTSDGTEVNLILKALFELLLANDGETPVFEVFKIGDETEEVLFSIASVDELEASAAGGAVLSDGATTDIIASDPINPDDPEINRLEGPILNSLRGNEITPSGGNIAATVSADLIELVETNAALTSTGILTSTDVDNADNLFTVSETIGTIGTFAIASSGDWTFLANSAFDALNVGDTVTEIYDVTSIDGTPSTVTITITGSNDNPTISAATASNELTEAGGINNGTAGTAASSITMSIADVDDTPSYDTAAMVTAGWTEVSPGVSYTKAGTYGDATFTVSTGVVGYLLDDSKTATQALDDGDTVTDSFTVVTTDGTATASANAVFTINGANDNTAPSLSAASYTISEDSAVGAIVGQVVATDLETPGSLVYSFDDDGTSKYDMFLINSSTGEITFSGTDGVNTFNLDYETVPNLYQLDVKVTDPSGLFDIKTMDINVSDLNLLVTGGGTVMVSNTNNAGGSTVDNGGQYGSHSEYFAFTDIVIAAGETISIELILSGNSNSYTGSNAHSYLVYDSDLNDSNNTLVTIHSVDETAGSYNGTWTITFDYENTSGSDITINTIYVSGKNNGFDFETYTVTSPETQDQVLTFDSATNNIDMLQLFSNAEDFEPDFVPTSLDIVDITAGNHILSNILAVDVLVMTDSDDTLKIIGDSNDSITLPTSEWTEGATAGGITTYTATNGNGAILEIESDINIIL